MWNGLSQKLNPTTPPHQHDPNIINPVNLTPALAPPLLIWHTIHPPPFRGRYFHATALEAEGTSLFFPFFFLPLGLGLGALAFVCLGGGSIVGQGSGMN